MTGQTPVILPARPVNPWADLKVACMTSIPWRLAGGPSPSVHLPSADGHDIVDLLSPSTAPPSRLQDTSYPIPFHLLFNSHSALVQRRILSIDGARPGNHRRTGPPATQRRDPRLGAGRWPR